jgi:capsular polysaccharide biosynthesis protein
MVAMELREFFKILYKKLWLVLLLPIIAAGFSTILSFKIFEPVYESKSSVYILSGKSDLTEQSYLVNDKLVKDCAEIIRSKSVTRSVIQTLHLTNITTEELASKIDIKSKNDTRVIEISVRSSDPEKAKMLTEEVSNVFLKKISHLLNAETIEVLDEAEVPYTPVKPRPVINIVIGTFVGLTTAICLVILTDYMNNTINTLEDVETQSGLVVLGIIPSLNIK